jgi:hypothetical protein
LIGVGVTNLQHPNGQLSLFDDASATAHIIPPATNPKVQAVVEQLRQRYGEQAIISASQLDKPRDK